jgi:signal transduction histidine kinase
MKWKPAVVTVPVFLALLSWLSFRASDPSAERYDRALKALDRCLLTEIVLHRDVLSARAGLLRNYDPLVQEVASLREAIGQLRHSVSDDAEEAAAIDQFAGAVKQQETLIEEFKSDNALLQNSLRHFRLLSARLSAADDGGPMTPEVSALAAAMLQLTLDTSTAAADEVADQLSRLATLLAASGEAPPVRALLAHGRLLHDLLPATDRLLRELRTPGQPQLKALRGLILTRQAQSRRTARGFRLLLYAASLLLLGLFVQAGLRLRARALALRRRAAFEHIIAGISTRMIDTASSESEVRIGSALAELAEYIRADRAYLVVACRLTRMHTWCREGMTFPLGWPDQAPALARQFGPNAEDMIHVADVDRLPPGANKDALVAARLRSWVCVARLGEDGGIVLGFDALRSGGIKQSPELGLLRMALDAMANFIMRDHLLQERARLEANLQQARRMETVGALASGIAHNFNNIVGAILGHAEMAELRLESGGKAACSLQEIRRSSERARDLVDQILAFARGRDQQREPVSIRGLVAETSSLLCVSLPERIELVIGEVPDAAVVYGQPAQLQQVILNLCNNAAQAMDQVGSIKLDTAVYHVTATRSLTHGDLGPGRYVRIAVTDSGRGIDEATLERIFQPFFTTRLAGNGLGLATVREIVREHGGAMSVWSAVGVGSRFEVWLPCSTTGATTSRDDPAALRLGHGETVLVVGDQSQRLLADEEILAALGYEPVGFTTASAALAACRTSPNRFDALLVGHLVRAHSALELAAALHDVVPDLPILLATASVDEIGADALAAAGISGVVHRPLISAEIAAALARCLSINRISVRASSTTSLGRDFTATNRF